MKRFAAFALVLAMLIGLGGAFAENEEIHATVTANTECSVELIKKEPLTILLTGVELDGSGEMTVRVTVKNDSDTYYYLGLPSAKVNGEERAAEENIHLVRMINGKPEKEGVSRFSISFSNPELQDVDLTVSVGDNMFGEPTGFLEPQIIHLSFDGDALDVSGRERVVIPADSVSGALLVDEEELRVSITQFEASNNYVFFILGTEGSSEEAQIKIAKITLNGKAPDRVSNPMFEPSMLMTMAEFFDPPTAEQPATVDFVVQVIRNGESTVYGPFQVKAE